MADNYAPSARRILGTALALAALGLSVAALAQGPARPQSVDDIVTNVLKGDAVSRPGARAVEPIIMGVRIGEHQDRTRFVVEVSDPVAMRTFTLSNPNRVVIDMPLVQWHLETAPRPAGNGIVRSYRYGLFRSGNSRFVIDLNSPVSVSNALVVPPGGGYGYRVVIDLFPTSQEKFDATAGWPPDLRAREAAAALLASLPPAQSQLPPSGEKHVVVIDAGHGGIDSGTNGVNGLQEKDVVLDEAQRLGRALAARPGYVVHLTRESDVYIPLKERVSIARNWRADLFISLHADSNPDPDVTGLSIYTLSERGSDAEAAALARKENQSDVIAGVDLGGGNSTVAPILIDLAQRDTMNRSSRFAESAVSMLGRATGILPKQPHRSAAFVVLKAPDVPSVLVELGYLSNAGDANEMNSARWRDRVAQAMAGAIDHYFTPAAVADP
ncbi:MAG TPA: N-acetylmuramoyl-L-alanine amidase [Rhizomicrobium sp.]|jgi:N-acetylmuramoyl-L-alanine amidase|nr:N-acetylmuramoyl-L-alanine amidase [Rhizomicrobium sp.]